MSQGKPTLKVTAVDAMIDRLTLSVFLVQLLIVFVLGIMGNAANARTWTILWYVEYPVRAPSYEFLIIPLRFELLCSIMIPISLKVTLDIAKGLYAKFIDWDLQMYDEENDVPARATNTALSEDLAQVEYVVTDKTGTLTENEMVFRRCCVGGVSFGNDSGDALSDPILLRSILNHVPAVIDFLMVMAVCNTVVPTQSSSSYTGITYKASSPDEEALVKASEQLRCQLVSRQATRVEVSLLGEVLGMEVLAVLEFTSDRKRMSVLVREEQSQRIRLFTKGADEVVFPRVRKKAAASGSERTNVALTQEAVEQYGNMGLRTLCLASRDVGEKECAAWIEKFKEAQSAVTDREWKVGEMCHILEQELVLLGATAIEDKLQEGVPETVEILRRAGISFWMLTGDKQSTARQIALACNLVLPEPEGQLLSIGGQTGEEVGASIEQALQAIRIADEKRELSLSIEGWCLEMALNQHYERFRDLVLESRTLLGCRITPAQKAQLVQVLKSCDFRTLAIGDGGNDVRMIQEAHVGVGLSGKEGQQAARAADYSIAKFRFLRRLILVHGRYSYHRTSVIAQFSIYKSLLLSLIQIMFCFWSKLSGTSLFNSFSLMAYNVIYTSMPSPAYALDKDIEEALVMANPQVLSECAASRSINFSTFSGWFACAIFHALVAFVVTMRVFEKGTAEFQEVGMTAFSGCVLLQTLTLILETNSFTIFQHLALWGELLVFLLTNLLVSLVPSMSMYTIMIRLCNDPAYWLSLLMMAAVGMAPLVALKALGLVLWPSPVQVLQVMSLGRAACGPVGASGLSSPTASLAPPAAAAGAAIARAATWTRWPWQWIRSSLSSWPAQQQLLGAAASVVATTVATTSAWWSSVGSSYCSEQREREGPGAPTCCSPKGVSGPCTLALHLLLLGAGGGRRGGRRRSSSSLFAGGVRSGEGGLLPSSSCSRLYSLYMFPPSLVQHILVGTRSVGAMALGRLRSLVASSGLLGESVALAFGERGDRDQREWEDRDCEREREVVPLVSVGGSTALEEAATTSSLAQDRASTSVVMATGVPSGGTAINPMASYSRSSKRN